jgi:transcriptional regulator with XRE-family HTH domain
MPSSASPTTKWGTRLREARLRASLSQIAVGHAIGVDQSTVSDWELGRHTPPDAKKVALASVLGCAVADLFPWPET